MPQWENSDRRERLPADWSRIRASVLRRDSHICQWRIGRGRICGEPATDVDHIRRGDDHDPSNLRALCSWHHQKKSSSEGGQAYQKLLRTNAKKFLRTEDHPGLL